MMSETPTVYIVTSGEYSNYRIRGVYLDKEAAQARADLLNRGGRFIEAEVEEWPSDGNGDDHYLFWAYASNWEIQWREYDSGGYLEPVVEESDYSVSVKSNDFDRGLKTMHDKIAEFKAREAGIA